MKRICALAVMAALIGCAPAPELAADFDASFAF